MPWHAAIPDSSSAVPRTLIDIVFSYAESGLCVLPARLDEKRPAVQGWKQYETAPPPAAQLTAWFTDADVRVCIVAGAVSGNLEMIDFDGGGELYPAWAELVPAELMARLVIEQSPSGGIHVVYRCEEKVSGNIKLASRKVNGKAQTLIETRGEGGLFLCAPSKGYTLKQLDLSDAPTISADERETLLGAAWSLNEVVPDPQPIPQGLAAGDDMRPGDDFNARGDVRSILVAHGWVRVSGGDNEHWRRPNKKSGTSATLKGGVFYVFSSNAPPFDPSEAYGPFSVCAMLEHAGDYAAAASALRGQGYGSPLQQPRERPDDSDVNLDDLFDSLLAPYVPVIDGSLIIYKDPGRVPAELLSIPGFIDGVKDYALATAPYPNRAMAFAGALALQAFLCGRKVRDGGDNRTNIYILGLAHSAAGKDWPRKINTRIIHDIGMHAALGERFASGEGIQDAMLQTPSMIFQTDEIDGMLQSINKSRDARHESVMGTLLTLYSSASSVFPIRRKAGAEAAGIIDQPCLTLFGTAIPNHYYESLSERMLTNGFFSRTIVLEGGARPKGQEPKIINVPPELIEIAQWWADYNPSEGNLSNEHPEPATVTHTPDAKALLCVARDDADTEYARAEKKQDTVGTTVWGRVSEQIRKLSLIYACSANHVDPIIELAAVEWATKFVTHQTRRMLYQAQIHVADNPMHADCLRLLSKLRKARGGALPHSVALKRMKSGSRAFAEIISTLEQQGDITVEVKNTAGRPGRTYHLTSFSSEEGVEGVGGE